MASGLSGSHHELQMLLLETYIQEAKQQLSLLGIELNRPVPDWSTAKRISHTLKGSARAVGMRSAERASLQLEEICRNNEFQAAYNDRVKQKARSLFSRIKYWSDEKTARQLFGQQPEAVVWCRDMKQGILYKALLGKEGYHVTVSDDLSDFDQLIDGIAPAALMLVLESAKEYLNSLFDIITEDPDWVHAPIVVFSENEFDIPIQTEVFLAGRQIAPGGLIVALEQVREASA